MSWTATNWAKQVRAGGPGPKAVLLCLADRADENESCFPSQELLAKETEQSVRTVQRQLADLEVKGLLRREHRPRGDGSGRTSDRYYLLISQGDNLSGDNLSPKVSTRQIDPVLHDTRVVGTPIEPSVKEEERALFPEPEPQPKPEKRQKPLVTIPDGWAPNDRHKEYAATYGINLGLMREQFVSNAGSTGKKYRDWDLAFNTWLSRERGYIERAAKPRTPDRGRPAYNWAAEA